jgi:hypothetical protein
MSDKTPVPRMSAIRWRDSQGQWTTRDLLDLDYTECIPQATQYWDGHKWADMLEDEE